MAGAAFLVTGMIDGLQHLFAQFCRFTQDRLHHVRRGFLETGKVVVSLNVENIVEHIECVFNRGCIAGHVKSPLDPAASRTWRVSHRPVRHMVLSLANQMNLSPDIGECLARWPHCLCRIYGVDHGHSKLLRLRKRQLFSVRDFAWIGKRFLEIAKVPKVEPAQIATRHRHFHADGQWVM